jgi:O-antigen biosynthesis protein WbqP
MKRLFDIFISLLLLVTFAIPMVFVAIAVKLTSRGPVLYFSCRVGLKNQIFNMPKFRSMLTESPVVATHLMSDADQWLTPIGSFIRKSSLDELPQLWSILKGDMSFVGPRPALFNQCDLIELRTQQGVHHIKPGLTGWAQVNGRDELSLTHKVQLDAQYFAEHNFWLDLKIIFMTFAKVLQRKGVMH